MNEIKELLRELCALPSVSGREKMGMSRLVELATPYFDEVRTNGFGSALFIKKSAKAGAPKMLLDAHLDEVGMMVSEIHDGGFLSVIPIGGLDTRVLPATEVTVYGSEPIFGIVTSVPPHLSGAGNKDVPKFTEIYIDTGYPADRLRELVTVGDVVEFKATMTELYGDRVASKSLDDKACLCAMLDMLRRADPARLEFDLYFSVSAQEEVGKNGASMLAYDIRPDIALAADVNFASGDGIEARESIEIGKGPSVDISSLMDVRLTRNIMSLLDKNHMPYQKICEPMRTSTNADGLSICNNGIRTALFSIPLESMHTPSEVVCLGDIKTLSDILLLVAYTKMEEL